MKRTLTTSLLVVSMLALSGCAVTTVAGAVVGAAISVTGAVVSTGVTVTGKAVGAVIDAASGSGKKTAADAAEAGSAGGLAKTPAAEAPASGAKPLAEPLAELPGESEPTPSRSPRRR